jgi:hypothetical protein
VGIIYPEYEKGKDELLKIVREELMKRNRRLRIHKEGVLFQ